jgi:hypothetical protein
MKRINILLFENLCVYVCARMRVSARALVPILTKALAISIMDIPGTITKISAILTTLYIYIYVYVYTVCVYVLLKFFSFSER